MIWWTVILGFKFKLGYSITSREKPYLVFLNLAMLVIPYTECNSMQIFDINLSHNAWGKISHLKLVFAVPVGNYKDTNLTEWSKVLFLIQALVPVRYVCVLSKAQHASKSEDKWLS